MRNIYVGRNNGVRDRLKASTDGGDSFDAIDLTTGSAVVTLILYETQPGTPTISRDSASYPDEFNLDSDGYASWTPPAAVVTAAMAGESYHCRWILVSDTYADGVVIPADDVQVLN